MFQDALAWCKFCKRYDGEGLCVRGKDEPKRVLQFNWCDRFKEKSGRPKVKLMRRKQQITDPQLVDTTHESGEVTKDWI